MALSYDANAYRFPSRRKVTYATRGMVCCSQPLAAQAGLGILKAGGNAIDAAVAAAACMTVVEPTSNGIGSDAFALIFTGGKLYGLNGSGPAPLAASAAKVRALGHDTMPERGWIPVNVPGAPSAWAKAVGRFGRLPLKNVLAPAAEIAQRGHAVTPTVAGMWSGAYTSFSQKFGENPAFRAWFDTFAAQGRAPRCGEIWRSPDHAATLRELGETDCESFYRGALAARIARASREQGGFLREEDLAGYEAQWQEPIHVTYRGYDVWEMPPNGHGIVALMALGMLEGMEPGAYGEAETVHRQLEAMKLAFADGKRYVADPAYMKVTTEQMLSETYLSARRALIGRKALTPACGDPACGGTVYLCAADGEGNMVSWIQSNYMGFGSGIVVPGTGIALNDRGANFSLDEGEENCLGPGKKSYHTIIPGFLTRQGRAVGPFGVMGGFMQPQGHVQVIMNTLDYHMNPQEALDAPRWQWVGEKKIQVEAGFDGETVRELQRRGHEVTVMEDCETFGRGQIIWRDENGVLAAGSEPRCDGIAAAW